MPTASTSPISHIIVLMLENRSFDQMLGCMRGVDGVSADNSNEDADGNTYFQSPDARDVLLHDPTHSLRSVLAQINAGAPNGDPSAPIDFVSWLTTTHHTMGSLITVIQEAWEGLKNRYLALRMPMSGFVKQFAADYPNSSREQRQQIMSYFPHGRLPALHSLAGKRPG